MRAQLIHGPLALPKTAAWRPVGDGLIDVCYLGYVRAQSLADAVACLAGRSVACRRRGMPRRPRRWSRGAEYRAPQRERTCRRRSPGLACTHGVSKRPPPYVTPA
jgi:hypothetical protein